jgi:hypothetical protein
MVAWLAGAAPHSDFPGNTQEKEKIVLFFF